MRAGSCRLQSKALNELSCAFSSSFTTPDTSHPQVLHSSYAEWMDRQIIQLHPDPSKQPLWVQSTMVNNCWPSTQPAGGLTHKHTCDTSALKAQTSVPMCLSITAKELGSFCDCGYDSLASWQKMRCRAACQVPQKEPNTNVQQPSH